ncbi:MAG: hypothetical protein EA361_04405 [Bacteroidetes bacterium]|nr:MAG: hypothetical protein EA361_04405 [Bacteroidota bacterium]
MKYLFSLVIFIHGAIHLLGFVKGFQWAPVEALTADISRPAAMLWLVAFLLFFVTGVGLFTGESYWMVAALLAIALSSVLIMSVWSDAKWGMVPNVILAFVVAGAFSSCSMNRMISKETDEILALANKTGKVVTESDINHLPSAVINWIKTTGILGQPEIHTVWVKQRALMKMKPGQKEWNHAFAQQYVITHEPSFLWTVEMDMSPLIKIKGRDKYVDGRGEMLIKMNSLINVVNEKGPQMDEGTLQRFLGELVWYPSVAYSPYIFWEQLDDYSARATMTYKGVSGSGVFYFDKDYNFIKFEALRYMGNKEDAPKHPWIITVDDYAVFDGIRVPSRMQATWKLDEGDWTWLKLVIEDLQYNVDEPVGEESGG